MSDTPDLTMLGEAGPNVDDLDIRDTTPEITPQTFDSSAFLRGVRPTRRSVQIVERADLVADLERLQGMFNEADEADDDEACERIAAEFEAVAEEFHASKRWYTVEKRSSEWVDHFRERTVEEHGLTLPAKEPRNADERSAVAEMSLRQLAEQIVAPSGVTYEDLRALYDHNEGELVKLLAAMTMANQQHAGSAQVATPGFSLRRSEKKATAGSSRR